MAWSIAIEAEKDVLEESEGEWWGGQEEREGDGGGVEAIDDVRDENVGIREPIEK